MRIIELMERPTSREPLAAWYAAVLEDQAASGVSKYADEIGISAGTLYQWRRRLASIPEEQITMASLPSGSKSTCIVADRHQG